MNLKNIVETVNSVSGLDITKNTRKRKYVYCRAIYYKIALDNTKNIYKKIINEVGITQHQTMLSLMSQFNDIINYRNYGEIYKSCLELLGLKVNEDGNKLTETQINVFNELKILTDSQLLEFKETRLNPFINMLNSRVTYENYN